MDISQKSFKEFIWHSVFKKFIQIFIFVCIYLFMKNNNISERTKMPVN